MNKHKGKKPKKPKVIEGIIKITSKPLGFVDDIIIYEENLNCALNKDSVQIELVGKGKGRVTKILERYKTSFVGTVEKSGSGLVFMPDDWKFYRKMDIFNFPKDLNPGTKVLVEMEKWDNPHLNPRGKVASIIGRKGEHETEMQSILLDNGIIYNFPPEVEAEAEKIAQEWKKTTSELSRKDFRSIITFTIDPADAKDFDDALSYEELGDGKVRVGVHIADVSHFVKEGSALDREAKKRMFSTYLVDRTIPMLPEALSNDICSLREGVDRFTFSAVFDIEQKNGKILERWFGKTIINSNKRFSYEEAQKILTSPRSAPQNDPLLKTGEGKNTVTFKEALTELDRLAKIYREQNKRNGAIEFETEEVKFELDSQGKPIKIWKKPRLDTMKMIEEWMLLANREVAKFISDKMEKKGGLSIFRVHDSPDMEKIEELSIFVRALGHELPIKNGKVTAKDINAMLKKIEGHAAESLIKTAAVRSMAKAVYSTSNIGHFGLAFKYYTHFTSPIRRYTDLVIHRILERHLQGQHIDKKEFSGFQRIAEQATEKEMDIAEAERDSIKYKQVEFMQSKIGQEFDAVISGVTEWGIYVEDPETKAEGLVRLRDLTDDRYILNEKNYAVVGERTKKKYSLGDKVRVRLVSADLERKTLDFKLI